ncbi:MAG TPA: protein kinase [Steroidobacteraceae bacterium]|nr:protein kinase [Steroidobacteraceae bacterium]
MSDDNPPGSSRPSIEQLGVLLRSVLELPPQDRERWIDAAGDSKVREQLRELLRQSQTGPVPRVRVEAPVSGGAGPEVSAGTSRPLPVPGDHLGRYEVIDLLGVGGMGTVYRARDATLGREVALKALAEAFRGDSASLRRFEREARVLATLNHPNIATIYGFERLEGSPFLVLERVEGDTLSQRLNRGPLPVTEALAVAVQIVAGLEEAHAQGVIHRDLKPSNVMLTRAGRVKLVDFGLAKTVDTRGTAQEAVEPITKIGIVLGTARYMSPEQVMGEDVDVRTDVWAFGCVLYEMLTGQPAFPGRSVSEAVAAVLRDDPDWRAIPAETPPSIVRLLRRCLRRNLHDRLHHIGDARLDLVEIDAEIAPAQTTRPAWMRVALLVTLAAVIAGAAALFTFLSTRTTRSVLASQPARLSLELPAGVTLANDFPAPFAIAPAGSPLILDASEGGQRRLYARELSEPALRALPGTEDARQPIVSTDGAWVAFFARRKLWKIPIAGGPVVQLADIGDNPRGAAWAPDGSIILATTQTSGLARVPERGDKPTPLTTLDESRGEYSHRWPDVLPGGKWATFTVGLDDATFDEGRIEAVSLETGERRVLVNGAGFARYDASSGRLLFVRGGQLHAVDFDPERLIVRGTPEVVVDAVRYDQRNGGTHLAVSATGVMLYGPGTPLSSDYYLSWVDQAGQLQHAVDTPRPFRDPHASPDGKRVAVVVGSAAESDLWLLDANGTLSRLSFGISPHRPTWTPDASGITVGAEKDGAWRLLTLPADGNGAPKTLYEASYRTYPSAWSPDGRYLLFQQRRPDTGWDLYMLQLDAAGNAVGPPQAFAATPFHEANASISREGSWVAYESDEVDGVVQIYARSFPDGGHKVRVSTGGARWPTWDAAGNLVFWQTGEDLFLSAPTHQANGQLTVDAPVPVWQKEVGAALFPRVVISVAGARYDVDPSGTRFLMLETAAEASRPNFSQPLIVLGAGAAPSASSRR